MRRIIIAAACGLVFVIFIAPASAVAAPPQNTSPPTITGVPEEGQTLTAGTGTWDSAETIDGFDYQWQKCATDCVGIAGATSSTLTLRTGQVGFRVRVVVTARSSAGSTPATSAPTGVVVVPVPQMTRPAGTLQKGTSASFPVAWAVAAPGTWLASYDVRYRVAFYDSGFGSPIRWLTGTTITSRTFSGLPGYNYCFSARARDTGGKVSAWSEDRCTALPVDDRTLLRSGPWSDLGGSGYYLQTISASATQGATLSLSQVEAKRLAVLVKKCSSCGEMEVFWNGASLGTFSLVASSTMSRQVIALPPFSSIQTGTVTIRVSSESGSAGHGTVQIDGLGVRRS